jgi:hypothetical protein
MPFLGWSVGWRLKNCLGIPHLIAQLSGAMASLQHLWLNVARCLPAAFLVDGGGESNGSLDFLKLSTLSFELANEYLAQDLHRIDAALSLCEALVDGILDFHGVLEFKPPSFSGGTV